MPGSDSPFRRLVRDLRRRKVLRVAGVYLLVAWATLQVGDVVVDPLRLPPWTMPLLIVILGLGFPVALVVAWAFELTPEGVRRTASPPASGSRALTLATFGLLLPLVGLGAYASLDAPASTAPDDRSIAVLPFDNVSGLEENAYFSDGITEDILTNLAKIRDLHRKRDRDQEAEALLRWAPQWKEQVLADRHHAFTFGPHLLLAEIAAALDQKDEALRHLRTAMEAGLGDPEWNLLQNPHFESLRTDPRFAAIVKEAEDVVRAERAQAEAAGLLW